MIFKRSDSVSDTEIMEAPDFRDEKSLTDSQVIPFKDVPEGVRKDRIASQAAKTPAFPAPSPGDREQAHTPTDPSNTHTVSVIGESLHFKGELSAGEDLIVEGTVEGKINQGKCCLTVKPRGQLLANVNATKIFIEGKVKGDMRATVSVTVRASGKVKGNIIAPKVALEEGATFNGLIEMRDPSVRKPQK